MTDEETAQAAAAAGSIDAGAASTTRETMTTTTTTSSPDNVTDNPAEERQSETASAAGASPFFLTSTPPPHQQQQSSSQASFASSHASSSSTSFSTHKHFFGAVANLCSATLGAGVLALPFALYQAGLVCGSILLCVSAWATASSIQYLVHASDRCELNTYEKVVQHVLGRKSRQVVEVCILIFCGGTAVAYLIAVGDILQQVIRVMTPSTKRWAMTGVWLIAMLPLSCLRRMQSLQCASTVGILSIGTLLLAATVHWIQDSSISFLLLLYPNNDSSEPEEWYYSNEEEAAAEGSVRSFLWPLHNSWMSVLRACPIVVFAFSCQVNVCQIYDELPGRRSRRRSTEDTNTTTGADEKVQLMNKVTWTAVALCGILYSSISVVTLMDFGASLKPNILSCYDLTRPHNGLLHAAFIGMALAVVMAFPLNIFPARVSIIQIIKNAAKRRRNSNQDGEIVLCGSLSLGDDDNDCREPLLPPVAQRQPQPQYSNADDNHNIEDPLQRIDSLDESMASSSATPIDYEDDFDLGQHMGVTLLVSGGALVLALLIPNISVVFGLLGGTTSSLLGFIIPGLLGLKLDPSDWTAWSLVVAGGVIGVLTTAVTVISTLQEL